jgi:signal-transduction protein with cAMP-binding, CBS, and nucleotidyltransferase domain
VERSIRRQGHIITIREGETAAGAARKMHENDIGCLVVLGTAGEVAGVITERDIIKKVVAQSENPGKLAVGEIMNNTVISCNMDTPLARAQRMMTAHGIRHIPIIEEGVAVGMLSSRDILAHQLSRTKAIARRQSAILGQIEQEYPELAHWRRDTTGRIIID